MYYRGRNPLELDYTLAERMLIAGRALWFYAGKLVWPLGAGGDLSAVGDRAAVRRTGAAAHAAARVARSAPSSSYSRQHAIELPTAYGLHTVLTVMGCGGMDHENDRHVVSFIACNQGESFWARLGRTRQPIPGNDSASAFSFQPDGASIHGADRRECYAARVAIVRRWPSARSAVSTWPMCDRWSRSISRRTAPSLSPSRSASAVLPTPCSCIAL